MSKQLHMQKLLRIRKRLPLHEIMAKDIDRLINVEMPHGKIAPLYEVVRTEGGDEPLTSH